MTIHVCHNMYINMPWIAMVKSIAVLLKGIDSNDHPLLMLNKHKYWTHACFNGWRRLASTFKPTIGHVWRRLAEEWEEKVSCYSKFVVYKTVHTVYEVKQTKYMVVNWYGGYDMYSPNSSRWFKLTESHRVDAPAGVKPFASNVAGLTELLK